MRIHARWPAMVGLVAGGVAMPGCFLTDEKLRDLLGDTGTGIEFVTVSSQTFDMGCTPGQSNCDSDESPVTPVTLTHDYLVSQTEITQGRFEAVMGYNPASFAGCGSDCPVENVSWHEAVAFAEAVSAAEALEDCYSCTGGGDSVVCEVPPDPYACEGYRLLTEAEWEGAARCGEETLYAGADDPDAVAWTNDNSGGSPQPVASLDPNACGLYDMSGNVFEWTQDWYDAGYYTSAGRSDPAGPGTGSYRVRRGGGWNGDPGVAQVANRSAGVPPDRSTSLGFRLARSLR